MAGERDRGKRRFEELSVEEQADLIIKERTPSKDQVIFEPTIEFLDKESKLTREERAKVVAMGDRTAISYAELEKKVIADREKQKEKEDAGEEVTDKTASFFQQYALAARSSDEIAHTSILEQLNPGPETSGGDAPIIMEGISILAGLRDVASQRYASFEALSSRGAIFPEGYWRIPPELAETRIGESLESINKKVYDVYLHLTRKALEEYLRQTPVRENEENHMWRYRWRVLNYALDDARQVTNGTFLNHLSFHPNNALALRETVAGLSANPLPETRAIADKLRQMAKAGLPTIMQYTEASPYDEHLHEIRNPVDQGPLAWSERGSFRDPLLLSGYVEPGSEKTFLAAFHANRRGIGFDDAMDDIRSYTKPMVYAELAEIFSGINPHDKPPKELELINVRADYLLTLGAVYELIRHRPMLHIVSSLGVDRGCTIPKIFEKLGLARLYSRAIWLNEKGFDMINSLGPDFRQFAAYYVTRAHLQPVTISMNGYEAFHFLRVRASDAAHPDIRKPAFETKAYLQSKSKLFSFLKK